MLLNHSRHEGRVLAYFASGVLSHFWEWCYHCRVYASVLVYGSFKPDILV